MGIFNLDVACVIEKAKSENNAMKIFSLLLPLISTQYHPPMGPMMGGVGGGFRPNQRNAFVPENGVMRKVAMSEHHVHQGAVCGKTLNYSLSPKGTQVLKSPQYPAGFSSQTQCVWTLSAPPGFRIKFEFEVFHMMITGNACMSTYLEFSDPEFGPADTNGARAMTTGGGGSFKLCGKNPGVIITSGNQVTVTLHADESGDPNQRFFLRLSATKEAPRVLRHDGMAVTNGRAKNEAPVVPGPMMMMPGSSSSMVPRGMVGRPTQRAPHQYGRVIPPKSVEQLAAERAATMETNSDSSSTTASVDNRMKNMGIMFLIIAITILLICAAVVLRRKLIQEPKDEKNEKKEPTTNNE